ncbi:MAG: SRPBCC family protein [Steroidobacter sp.]
MATIRREMSISAAPEEVWDVIRDIGAVHTRLAPGFVVDTQLEEGPARVVEFANGFVVRELIVGVDQEARRLAYSVVGGNAQHHNASFQVFCDGERKAKLVWITDVLPESVAATFEAMIDQGVKIMQPTLSKLNR